MTPTTKTKLLVLKMVLLVTSTAWAQQSSVDAMTPVSAKIEENTPVGREVIDLADSYSAGQSFEAMSQRLVTGGQGATAEGATEGATSGTAAGGNQGAKVDLFRVDSSGRVTVKRAVDRERLCGRSTLCQVVLLILQPERSFKLTITISDTNDNIPVFRSCLRQPPGECRITLNVSEALAPGDRVPADVLRASDADVGLNGDFNYLIRNNECPFSIVEEGGHLFLELKRKLDYERDSRYEFVLRASDKGVERRRMSAAVLVRVSVRNVNEHAPRFNHPNYDVTLSEKMKPGQLIATVQAFDRDAAPFNQIRYALAPSTDANGGTAQDAAGADEKVVEGGDVSTSDVTTSVGNPAWASDLVGVDASSGEVRLLRSPDWKIHNGAKIKILAYDSPIPKKGRKKIKSSVVGLVGSCLLLLQVEDTNDKDPQISFVFSTRPDVMARDDAVYIAEDIKAGAYFALVSVTDADRGQNARIELTLRHDDVTDDDDAEEAFGLEVIASDEGAATGKLVVRSALDREKRAGYCVVVRACDSGVNQRCGERRVNVAVADANDNSPIFDQPQHHVTPQESAPVGSVVAVVRALDDDASRPPVFMMREGNITRSTNGEITYSIVNGNGDFEIDPRTGEVRVAKPLDREKIAQYKLTVRARDGGLKRARESTTSLMIDLLDVNDNRPLITAPSRNGDRLYASVLADQVVVRVQAVDGDAKSNGQLAFRLMSSSDDVTTNKNESLFVLDEDSGELRVNFKLEDLARRLGPHNLLVEVRDHGKPPKRSERSFVVTLIDTPLPRPSYGDDGSDVMREGDVSGGGGNESGVGVAVVCVVVVGLVLVSAALAGYYWYTRCYSVKHRRGLHGSPGGTRCRETGAKQGAAMIMTSPRRGAKDEEEDATASSAASSSLNNNNRCQEQRELLRNSTDDVTRDDVTAYGRGDFGKSNSRYEEMHQVKVGRSSTSSSSSSSVGGAHTSSLGRHDNRDGTQQRSRKTSYHSQNNFDARSSNVSSSAGTKITSLNHSVMMVGGSAAPTGGNRECDSGRGDSSPDVVSHSADSAAPINPYNKWLVSSSGAPTGGSGDTLGPYCTSTCLTEGHHDGCWMHQNNPHPSTSPSLTPSQAPSSPQSLYVDLYPAPYYYQPYPQPHYQPQYHHHQQRRLMTPVPAMFTPPQRPSTALQMAHGNHHPLEGANTTDPKARATFRRSASTDAILRSSTSGRALASAGDEELSVRESRAIVANIERLLAASPQQH